LQKRGALDGLVKLVGGSDAAALEDCCTKGDEADPEDKGDDPDEGTIDGERPDDGDNEKGMDGTYRMPDGSFADWDDQSCTPDESWAAGTHWVSSFNSMHRAATAASAINSAFAEAKALSTGCMYMSEIVRITNNSYASMLKRCTTGKDLASLSAIRLSCLGVDADYCKLTQAPCKEDQEWPTDGKCQEALINGRFVPHPNDPDCAGRLPQDYQVMCNTDKCIAYIPTKDGGHMRVEVDPVTRLPVAGSDVKTYSSDGQFKGSNEYRYDNVKYNAYGEYSVPTNWE
jgi:hypothetical protein